MSKLDYKHVPAQLLDGAAETMAYGNTKYGEGKVRAKKSADDRYNSLMGHLQAWKRGETADSESGLCHLKHAAAQLGFLMAASEGVEKEFVAADGGSMARKYWVCLDGGDFEVWRDKPEWNVNQFQGLTGLCDGMVDYDSDEWRKVVAATPWWQCHSRSLLEIWA